MALKVDSPRVRISILGVVAVALFATLFARLWFLQVLDDTDFEEVARANSTRVIYEQAPRGEILDRNGVVLVGNRSSLQVSIDRFAFNQALPDVDDQRALLLELAREMSRTGRLTKLSELEAEVYNEKYGTFDIIPVVIDVTEEFQILLAERADEFPGVTITKTTVRTYPYGTLAAHMLGYVGPINEEELERVADKPKTYQPNDDIGKTGIELMYEDELRGSSGRRVIEVDAQLNPIRTIDEELPVAGNDVQLTLDVNLQAMAESELKTALEGARRPGKDFGDPFFFAPAGATVILDPEGSDVLAMASYPTFDPADFVNGISQEDFDALQAEGSHFPLNNRAIQGLYAPGSTFKPFTAYAAMDTGLIGPRGILTPDEKFVDNGVFTVPNCEGECEFSNANDVAYGAVNLAEAMTVSSDVYFYNLAFNFDYRPDFRRSMIAEGAEVFGFGASTNVPLPFEQPGFLPTPANKAQRNLENPEAFPDGNWYTADTINTSVGQGDISVTPLQLANAYVVLANGGTLYSPNVAHAVLDPVTGEALEEFGHRVKSEVYLPDAYIDPIMEGLLGVTQTAFGDTEFRGTAFDAFKDFPNADWPVAAKTGTSEKEGKADFALFAAIAPMPEPEYVAVTVLEEAGFGGNQAAPAIENILFAIQSGTVPPAPTAEQVRELRLAGELEPEGEDSALAPEGGGG